jgi:hypothetical protein
MICMFATLQRLAKDRGDGLLPELAARLEQAARTDTEERMLVESYGRSDDERKELDRLAEGSSGGMEGVYKGTAWENWATVQPMKPKLY